MFKLLRQDQSLKRRLSIRLLPVVGSLLYASILLRPDIAFAVIVWSRLSQEPTKENLLGAKKVAQYLKSTKDLVMKYKSSGFWKNSKQIKVQGFTDSSYGSEKGGDQRSTSGFVVYLGNCPITYKVKLQREVCLSVCEAEIIGLSYCISHLL